MHRSDSHSTVCTMKIYVNRLIDFQISRYVKQKKKKSFPYALSAFAISFFFFFTSSVKILRHRYREYVVHRERKRERQFPSSLLNFPFHWDKLDLFFLLSFTVGVLNGTLFLKKIRLKHGVNNTKKYRMKLYGANFF